MTNDKTVTYRVGLPRDLYEQLEHIRQEQDRRSVSNVIVFALHEWLKGRGKESPLR